MQRLPFAWASPFGRTRRAPPCLSGPEKDSDNPSAFGVKGHDDGRTPCASDERGARERVVARRRQATAFALLLATLSGAPSALSDPSAPVKPVPPSPSPSRAPTALPMPVFKDLNVLKISELAIAPALPKAGETVTVRLTVRNESALPLSNVAWTATGPSQKSGIIQSLAPKSTQTVTYTFTAPNGAFELTASVDPSNRIPEPTALRANNQVTLKVASATATGDWATWSRKAAARFPEWFPLFRLQTTVEGIITGSILHVFRLRCATSSTTSMTVQMQADGIPSDVADAIANAFVDTYRDWASSYHVDVPFAYPTFVGFPGPVAPPTPNVPFPLILGGFPAAALPSEISSRLQMRIPVARKTLEGESAAVTDMARALSGQFMTFMAVQQVNQVMGTGPVPTFAPPAVPVGAVVMGTILPAPTHLQ